MNKGMQHIRPPGPRWYQNSRGRPTPYQNYPHIKMPQSCTLRPVAMSQGSPRFVQIIPKQKQIDQPQAQVSAEPAISKPNNTLLVKNPVTTAERLFPQASCPSSNSSVVKKQTQSFEDKLDIPDATGPNFLYYFQKMTEKRKRKRPSAQKKAAPKAQEEVEEVELPEADPKTLEEILGDTMTSIRIDDQAMEIRYYGHSAVIFMSWDDPRDIIFEDGDRTIVIDGMEINCRFNEDGFREFSYDGRVHRIKLGVPTRELFIDDKWYQCSFEDEPMEVELQGNKQVMLKIEGPRPSAKIGTIKRTDLVLGRINVVINATMSFAVYLDAKPQVFQIAGKPVTLEFVDSLRTVLLNGRPFEVEFGGPCKSFRFLGQNFFISFSELPKPFRPACVRIAGMKGKGPNENVALTNLPDKSLVLAPELASSPPQVVHSSVPSFENPKPSGQQDNDNHQNNHLAVTSSSRSSTPSPDLITTTVGKRKDDSPMEDQKLIGQESKRKRTYLFFAQMCEIVKDLSDDRRKRLERDISALVYRAEDEQEMEQRDC